MTEVAVESIRPGMLPIYAPELREQRLTWRGRGVCVLIALACLAVLLAAAYLEPDSAGVGRQTRLGMQPCGFLVTTGLPCAACGMTTSFNHFVRAQWLSSLWTQPMGFLLAVGTCLTFWAALYIGLTGRPAHRLLKRLPVVRLLILAAAVAIAAWGWKISLTVLGLPGTHA